MAAHGRRWWTLVGHPSIDMLLPEKYFHFRVKPNEQAVTLWIKQRDSLFPQWRTYWWSIREGRIGDMPH